VHDPVDEVEFRDMIGGPLVIMSGSAIRFAECPERDVELAGCRFQRAKEMSAWLLRLVQQPCQQDASGFSVEKSRWYRVCVLSHEHEVRARGVREDGEEFDRLRALLSKPCAGQLGTGAAQQHRVSPICVIK
jgi:hypothetical protein